MFAATACNPATTGEPPVVKAFGAQGWGALKPGMTKQDALATGELEREPLAVIGDCDFYSLTGGQRPDPTQTAADQAYTQAHRTAVNRVAELTARVGPPPPPNAPAKDQVEWASRNADAARAVGDVAIAASELTQRADQRSGPTNPAGTVSFHNDKLRLITAPQAARTTDGIGAGTTLDDLRKTYLGRSLTLTTANRYEMPARGRAGWTLDFDYTGTQVTSMQLRDTSAKCT